MKKIVYVDMDGVLVDFNSGKEKLSMAELEMYEGRYDEVPHIFSKMEPMENAIESYIKLCEKYETYILSTSPWENPTALNDKLEWVKKHLGDAAHKRLILFIKLNTLIYYMYELTYDEVLVVEPEFSERMSREDYEELKVE